MEKELPFHSHCHCLADVLSIRVGYKQHNNYDYDYHDVSDSSSSGGSGNLKIIVDIHNYDPRESNVCLYESGNYRISDALDCTAIGGPGTVTFDTNMISEGDTFNVCIDYDGVCQSGENEPERARENNLRLDHQIFPFHGAG
jgi:hypothetical protein